MSGFDCGRFLREDLPASMVAGPRAVVQVVVVDRDDCDLAYTISESGISVSDGISDECDLTLSFVSADLAALAAGTLDIRRAIRTKRLKVMGDESLLARIGRAA